MQVGVAVPGVEQPMGAWLFAGSGNGPARVVGGVCGGSEPPSRGELGL